MLRRELAREKMWARIHLIPVLQAEADRDQVRRYWADQAREKELLGHNIKVYNNDKYAIKQSQLRVNANVEQIHPTYIRGDTFRDQQMKELCIRNGLSVHKQIICSISKSKEVTDP